MLPNHFAGNAARFVGGTAGTKDNNFIGHVRVFAIFFGPITGSFRKRGL
jgi:hypothetical protein